MSSLDSLVLGGSLVAIKIIQQYIANPTIAGIPIECESYREVLEAEISQQLIIAPLGGVPFANIDPFVNRSGKQYISDNIAPKPRVFSMKGWVAPSFIELTALSPILMPILQLKLKRLRGAFNSRELLLFTTKNHEETLNVGIVSMEFESMPDVANRQPISLTVREMPILNSSFASSAASPVDIQNVASVASATSTLSAIPFADTALLGIAL